MSYSADRFRPAPKPRLWRGCGSKHRYENFHAAERARLACEDQRGTALRVYDCEICSGWHLTSAPFKPRRHK